MSENLSLDNSIITAAIRVTGIVQGVGFRPFIFRIAVESGISGWVRNDPMGVEIQATAPRNIIEQFAKNIKLLAPPASKINSIEIVKTIPGGELNGFEIIGSSSEGVKQTIIPPDMAICEDCFREMNDPADRRYCYPFINCINCGPRFSIMKSIPYDRCNTTMAEFVMCDYCKSEYENPANRRFHAQPIACPVCGPHLFWLDVNGHQISENESALEMAVSAIKDGKIVALKGLGGYQLLVLASNEAAIAELRKRKKRDEKPLALMYPNLAGIQADCILTDGEAELLKSYKSPIVILPKRDTAKLSELIAPGNPNLGVMIPYTPLHHLLMSQLNEPVICTSGNLSDEPICIDDAEAVTRLREIADGYLAHNRHIARHIDDSVVRFMDNEPISLRRGRGYAPSPIQLKYDMPPALAVGSHLKNTIAVSVKNNIFVSQHIGDLETLESHRAFYEVLNALSQLYDSEAETVACDMHPDYFSTQHARKLHKKIEPVQHHSAHIWSCLAENMEEPPVLGVSWDGTGFGMDGTIWGGEFLLLDKSGFKRAAHLRKFRLPGSDKAVKEPKRTAIGLLYELFKEETFRRSDLLPVSAFEANELRVIEKMLKNRFNSPETTAVGRLFDAVASIIGIRQTVRFEGQAAMELEFSIQEKFNTAYPFGMIGNDPIQLDWEPMITAIILDKQLGVPTAEIAIKFHNTLVNMIVETAKTVGQTKIALSGGCFQNKYLFEKTKNELVNAGFTVLHHHEIPPNDNGIALGQLAFLAWKTHALKGTE